MKTNSYIKPAWTHNGSVRTDLPVIVMPRMRRKGVSETLSVGQLACVGKVYIKTQNDLIRIR